LSARRFLPNRFRRGSDCIATRPTSLIVTKASSADHLLLTPLSRERSMTAPTARSGGETNSRFATTAFLWRTIDPDNRTPVSAHLRPVDLARSETRHSRLTRSLLGVSNLATAVKIAVSSCRGYDFSPRCEQVRRYSPLPRLPGGDISKM